MIRFFERSSVMFPFRWANSVSAWICGLHSTSGTVRIGNNLDPSRGSPSASIDVNVEALYAKLRERLNRDYVAKDALAEVVDQTSLSVTDGLLQVRSEYVRRVAKSNAQ